MLALETSKETFKGNSLALTSPCAVRICFLIANCEGGPARARGRAVLLRLVGLNCRNRKVAMLVVETHRKP